MTYQKSQVITMYSKDDVTIMKSGNQVDMKFKMDGDTIHLVFSGIKMISAEKIIGSKVIPITNSGEELCQSCKGKDKELDRYLDMIISRVRW